jgi:glycosyltransferase involved in cell wall biosynthesis
MAPNSYVLVTPARNESATIGETIRSVLAQTLLPKEWVIVSDGSTDGMDDIVQRHADLHPFIRLLRREPQSGRNFAAVVYATEAGLNALRFLHYDFIGLLDADVRFKPDYFETLISRFASNPRLGLAGGIVLDVPIVEPQHQYLKDIAGAAQFFRRECFNSLGGLIPIPEGGWDAITNLQARANGYDTQTFPDLVVEHLKPRNSAEGGVFRRKWQLGVRDYALGYHPFFEIAKCVARWREKPLFLGSIARWVGFTWATFCFRSRILSVSIVRKVRQEQWRRMTAWARVANDG